MLKKIFIILVLIFSFWIVNVYWANCNYSLTWSKTVLESLEDCIDDTNLVQQAKIYDEDWNIIEVKDLKVDNGFKKTIMAWTKKIGWFLGLWAIFAIAFGSLKMTLSGWKEEEIKKGKDIVKWWILWFLLVVSGWFIVWVVVNVIYWVLW